MYAARDLENPAVIVDANHSNSGKQYLEQIRIVKEVLHSCHHSADVKKLVKGVMIESYIELIVTRRLATVFMENQSQTHASDGLSLKSFYTILQTLLKNIFIMSGLM